MKMNEKRTGLFENGLIWFGAGVSIAEILTGTYLAPLGMGKGLAAILIGHIIGCLMLFLAGVIGGRVRKSAMETVKMSFGQKGSILFAVLNVLQLVGWTVCRKFKPCENRIPFQYVPRYPDTCRHRCDSEKVEGKASATVFRKGFCG